ncbi:MAG: hypothetical protein ACK5XN_37500, partial [Bacteroidota bacterium]
MTHIQLLRRVILLSFLFSIIIQPVTTYAEPTNADDISRTDDQYTVSGDAIERRFDGVNSIPVTSNPTGNGNPGVRVISNPSFELPNNPSGLMTCEANMSGWFTTHSNRNDPGIGTAPCPVFEMWRYPFSNNVTNRAAPDGVQAIELSAYDATMAYQPICMRGGESFDFEFHHMQRYIGSHPYYNQIDTISFRFGIPNISPSSKTADIAANSLEVIRVENTWINGSTPPTVVALQKHANTSSVIITVLPTYWARIRGTFQTPSDFSGIRNLGFQGITPAGSVGNILDAITINLKPIVDFGISRDSSGNETSTPQALNIRINGRVVSGTKIMLQMAEGTATPDTDFALGAVDAGAHGTGSIEHITGSNNWLITIPPGDYDGGVFASNDVGGLTIPITYTSDAALEPTEYIYFKILPAGKIGSSTNWLTGDPTCDGSRKIDGVVYSIVDVGPTSTPVPSLTMTPSRTPSPTFTLTPTNT